MTEPTVPPNYGKELEYGKKQIQDLLQIADYNRAPDIVTTLINKKINLDPAELQKLFSFKFDSWSNRERFNVMRRIINDLRQQGILIRYLDDKVHIDEGRECVHKSRFHGEGPIPVGDHNRADYLRYIAGETTLTDAVNLLHRQKAKAKEIHETYRGRMGWEEWNESRNPMNAYQALAEQNAVYECAQDDIKRIRGEVDSVMGTKK